MVFSKKVTSIQPSVTLAITAKSARLREEGKDVISFGAGEPDFNTPENIQAAAIRAMQAGKTKYTSVSGITELKQAIADKFRNDNGLDYELSEILVSTGAKQSLANAFLAALNEGDEVLMAVPYWVTYPELVKLAGGIPVYCEGTAENNYKLSRRLLEQYLTDRSKAIILNSPNNPTGAVYTEEELTEIAAVAREHDLLIISDEMYEKLIYGENRHYSIAAVSEDAFRRTLTINGVSKAYAMTGWRLGYAAGPKELIKLMTSVQSHLTGNAGSVTQYAAVEALTGNQSDLHMMVAAFKERRDLLVDLIRAIPGVSCARPEGAFYVMMNVEALIGRKHKGQPITSALDFSDRLLSEQLVAVVPGEGFGQGGHVRFSYATSEDNIRKGLARVAEFIRQLEA